MMPVYVMFGTTSYRDGIDLDPEQSYRLLRGAEQLPTTSQPTVVDLAELYTALSSQTEAIVSIRASKKMSATLDSAQTGVLQRPDVPIHVIDCRTISMSQGLLATASARVAAAGEDAGQTVQLVESLMPRRHLIITVETLEYLRKAGRIGGATAWLGSAIRIRPVLHMKDGQVEPLEKPRTKRKRSGGCWT